MSGALNYPNTLSINHSSSQSLTDYSFDGNYRQRSVSTPELDSPLLKRQGSSCQALRHALLTLYRLDDFILEPLGNGFFSDVYKVTHKVSGEVMVLKMNKNSDNRSNVLREVQLMKRLSHPNILKFLGVCVHEGQLSALTEFVNGGNLHELLMDKTEELDWADRLKLSLDISNGLQYLHGQGVFHRDLTSRNVLVSVDGKLRKAIVADFGLAAEIPDKTSEEFRLSVVGSPYWMAPECIHGLRYDERADVFSYGIILCEIIARIDADPDIMPRTENFGLDYVAYSSLAEDSPLHFLYLAFRCCQMEPCKRPTFSELSENLSAIQEQITSLQRHNPSTNRAFVSSGHVRRHVHKFSGKDVLHKRSKSAGQNLDFLRTETPDTASATAQYIGEHMTREDQYYKPSAGTNPFELKDHLRGGQKILAMCEELDDYIDISVTLPIINDVRASSKKSHSLPDNTVMVKKALEQFNTEISSSRINRKPATPTSSPIAGCQTDECSSIDSALDCSSIQSEQVKHDSSSHSKQLKLECALIFSGLDLIGMNRSKACAVQHVRPSVDLESEYQDDLEDVLRSCSSSESWLDDTRLSSPRSRNDSLTSDSSDYFNSRELGLSRYLHPTLVEKRRQLRRVECRNSKAKIEYLQSKLDKLKLETRKKPYQ